MKKIRVWDLPLRLFHWVLALLIVVSVVTQQIGGNAMEWHFLAGYAALTLVLFRILWGVAGTRYARLGQLFHGPSAIAAYLGKGRAGAPRRYLGHNPLGSLSVLALLGVVLAQAVSGLFANDDIASEGPLARFISKDWSDRLTWFHTEVSATLVYILVALHVAAVAYYFFLKRENLVKPMFTGDKETEADAPAASDGWAVRLWAAALLLACAAGVYWLVNLEA
ncbi:MAG: cytochrome b/b6 domain-containing protein [Noviherbaspirillum sp.]